MENLPVLYEQSEINIGRQGTTQEIEHVETTPFPEEKWDEVTQWVEGLVATGPLEVEREWGLDKTTATAVFEKLQEDGYVTKQYVDIPAKNVVERAAYDPTKFGGYMVLKGKEKPQLPPDPRHERIKVVTPAEELDRSPGRVKRFLGKTSVGRAVVTSSEEYGALSRHRVNTSANFVSGQTHRERKDSKNLMDRQYASIFNQDDVEWEPTVPRIRLIPTSTTNAERIGGAEFNSPAGQTILREVEELRQTGMNERDIKRTLLKQYHPDARHGGDIEKSKLISSMFMSPQEHDETVPTITPLTSFEASVPAATDETGTPQVQKVSRKESTEAAQRAKETARDREREQTVQQIRDPYEWALKYVAGYTRVDTLKVDGEDVSQNKVPFPTMSPESFIGACGRYNVPLSLAIDLYDKLRLQGFIDDDNNVNTSRVKIITSAYIRAKTGNSSPES